MTGLRTLSSLNSRNHQPILHEKKKRWSENEVNGKIVTQDFSLHAQSGHESGQAPAVLVITVLSCTPICIQPFATVI